MTKQEAIENQGWTLVGTAINWYPMTKASGNPIPTIREGEQIRMTGERVAFQGIPYGDKPYETVRLQIEVHGDREVAAAAIDGGFGSEYPMIGYFVNKEA